MKSKCYTFTVSKSILTTHSNTNISQYVKETIKYFLDLKNSLDLKSSLDLNDYKLIFSPETELLFKPAQHCQISVRLSDDDVKTVKKISKHYNKNLSTTIDNMLQMYEIIQTKGYSAYDVLKLNERICLKSSKPDCPKITGDLIAKKTKKIKLRLPNGNNSQTITAETLYKSIEYAPDNIHLSADEIKSMIQKFNDKYKSSNSETIEARITEQQMDKLDRLKTQIASLLKTKNLFS